MPALSHKDDYYETPRAIVDDIENTIGRKIEFDICANDSNHLTKKYFTETDDALEHDWFADQLNFMNPPRSKNGKFVMKMIEEWDKGCEIIALLCWNDFGNKYGEKLWEIITDNNFILYNLGKVIFYKNGQRSEFPSRLNYFWTHLH